MWLVIVMLTAPSIQFKIQLNNFSNPMEYNGHIFFCFIKYNGHNYDYDSPIFNSERASYHHLKATIQFFIAIYLLSSSAAVRRCCLQVQRPTQIAEFTLSKLSTFCLLIQMIFAIIIKVKIPGYLIPKHLFNVERTYYKIECHFVF